MYVTLYHQNSNRKFLYNYNNMKRFFFISIVALIVFSMNVSAKDAKAEAKSEASAVSSVVVLKGIVSDKTTNESLAGAVITANGQKVYSDLDGNFIINNLCEGKCTIKVSLISYEDKTLVIDTNESKKVEIKLNQL